MNHFFFPRILFLLGIVFFVPSHLWGMDCPNCQAKNIPELGLLCPNCGEMVNSAASKFKEKSAATLVIEIVYTGDSLRQLPEYGKFFLNRKYKGNIPLIEKEGRSPILLESGHSGIGHDFTAIYRGEWRNLNEGMVDVQLEMMFQRFSGMFKSFRRAEYSHISLKAGEKKIIRHEFNSQADFTRKPPARAGVVPTANGQETNNQSNSAATTPPDGKAGSAPGEHTSKAPEPFLKTGDGTIAIELPFLN